MRFGRHSHDTAPDRIDSKAENDRDRLVKLLHDLADRIEHAPMDRITDSLALLTSSVDPLVRMVERALKAGRPKT